MLFSSAIFLTFDAQISKQKPEQALKNQTFGKL
jgi:hypothetical protein